MFPITGKQCEKVGVGVNPSFVTGICIFLEIQLNKDWFTCLGTWLMVLGFINIVKVDRCL